MSELLGIARFKFHEGKVEDFKRLSAQQMEIVRSKETGTLQYEIYFNDDQYALPVNVTRFASLGEAVPSHCCVGSVREPIAHRF